MDITIVRYCAVDPRRSAPPAGVVMHSSIDAMVERYLVRHLDELCVAAEKQKAAPARFVSADAARLFEALRCGSVDAFQTAFDAYLAALVSRWDRRAKAGFLVGVRAESPSVTVAALLKLDIQATEVAARARGLADGQVTLEGVTDLLDRPGNLHKGALTPDPRGGASDVVISDHLDKTSDYFLDTVGARQSITPARATGSFLEAVRAVAPERVPAVAAALAGSPSIGVSQLFDEHPDLLTTDERDAVVMEVSSGRRPIVVLDAASSPPFETIVADDLTVQGPATTLDNPRRVRITPRAGGFEIVINVDSEPRRQYR